MRGSPPIDLMLPDTESYPAYLLNGFELLVVYC